MPIITTIILLCSGAFGCSLDTASQQEIPKEEQPQIPDQESWKSSLTITNGGQIKAKIQFGHMSRFNETKSYELDQKLHIDFYNKDGKQTSWLKSEKGTFNEINNMMEASGDVVTHSDSANVTVYTERLTWNEQQRKIVSNEEVMITAEQDTLYGVGFESDVNFRKWVIKKPRGHSYRSPGIRNRKRVGTAAEISKSK